MGCTPYTNAEISVIHLNDFTTIGYTPYTTVELWVIHLHYCRTVDYIS
jgi:hypothetical protein